MRNQILDEVFIKKSFSKWFSREKDQISSKFMDGGDPTQSRSFIFH